LKDRVDFPLIFRIALPYVILVTLIIAGLGFYFSNFFERSFEEEWKRNLESEALLLGDVYKPYLISGDMESLQNITIYHADQINSRLTLILPDGTVVGESELSRQLLENHLSRVEVQAALNNQTGYDIRESATLQKKMLYVATPIVDSGNIIGISRIAIPFDLIEQNSREINRTIFGFTVAAVLIAIIFAFFITQRTLAPLRQLTFNVKKMDIEAFKNSKTDSSIKEINQMSSAFVLMATRLSEQIEEFKAERGKLSAVLMHMTDAVLIVDSDGMVQLINLAAEQMFDTSQENALGHSIVEVIRYYQLVELWKKCLQTDEQQTATTELLPNRMFVQSIATPLHTALPGNILLVFQDLTRIHRLETVRSDFVSNVSHELRTPIASLKALTETLQEGALEDPPAARKFLQRMDSEIDNLTQLVRELLELSRIESGKLPLEKRLVSPYELTSVAVERMQLQAERAGLSLTLDCSPDLPDVFADPERIGQVFVNLIHNAIKFTPPGGAITVSASLDGNKIIMVVRDTGVGISPDALPRIFERFYKADRARSGGGTGLGLSIAKHTVEAHGGRIWAESKPDEGSRFYIALSVAKK